MNDLSEENYIKSVDAQIYLLHYDWEYYFDEYHNIHVELDKNHYIDQHDVLFEHFDYFNNIPVFFDEENIEIILQFNQMLEVEYTVN